jgi:2-iminobutanoate/2-iminopropanoate deaminase
MRTKIDTQLAPKATGFYSQAIESNGFVFVAGQIHITPDGKMVEGSVEKKVTQIMKNCEAILKRAGANFMDVVKVSVFVTDIKDLPKLNEVYARYFPKDAPAREAICVKALPLGATIEISMIAEK